MAKSKSIKITLEFTEEDLNEFLDAANFTDAPSLTVADLSASRMKALKKELQDTAPNFVQELIEGSEEACANDWLSDFAPNEDDYEDE